jgi:hypothetical protein
MLTSETRNRRAATIDDVVAIMMLLDRELWALRSTPTLHDRFFMRLDRFTGFAGRGLLVPLRSRIAGQLHGDPGPRATTAPE